VLEAFRTAVEPIEEVLCVMFPNVPMMNRLLSPVASMMGVVALINVLKGAEKNAVEVGFDSYAP
jgi:hypothetical protein